MVEEIIMDHLPGIRLITSGLGEPAVKLATDRAPDLILPDINLPDLYGSEVLKNPLLWRMGAISVLSGNP